MKKKRIYFKLTWAEKQIIVIKNFDEANKLIFIFSCDVKFARKNSINRSTHSRTPCFERRHRMMNIIRHWSFNVVPLTLSTTSGRRVDVTGANRELVLEVKVENEEVK